MFQKDKTMIRKQKAPEQALLQLTALCSQGEHCLEEMQTKLQRWGIMGEEQQRILNYLVDEGYVSHERFCRAFIHDKMEYNGWGRRRIEAALWQKRIPRTISDTIFADITTEQWVEHLRPLLAVKRRSVKGDNEYDISRKLTRFALSRGFSFEEIRLCNVECDESDYEDEFDNHGNDEDVD